MTDMTYINEQGFEVFTSQYLKNKKTCCRSACLHCPYGFTLKKHGLTFLEVAPKDISSLEEIISEGASVSLNLEEISCDNIRWILLKDVVCGFFVKNHIQIKHLFLKKNFQDQGLSKEMIESYFF